MKIFPCYYSSKSALSQQKQVLSLGRPKEKTYNKGSLPLIPPMALGSLEKKDQQESLEAQKKTPKLSEDQLQYAEKELDTAVKEGVLRREDRMKVYAQMDRMTSAQIANAGTILDDYIGKKREKREEYTKELDSAVGSGLLSKDEQKQYLAKYDKMSGKDRQKEFEEKWPQQLEAKKMEKKDFESLIKESPHFFHEGKITKEGQKLLDEQNNPLKNDREKLVLKRRLIKNIKKLDSFADLCKERYQIANEHYNRGEYESAAQLMKKNTKTCERYPESARLQEFKDFAIGNSHNANYELLKNQQMNEKRDEVQECFQGDDYDSALECADEAVQMMKDIIAKTYDGALGEYQEGSSPEKERSEKWITPYMRKMLAKVEGEQSQSKNIAETLKKQEESKEQQILDGEIDVLYEEQASDKRDQVLIKAAIDSANSLGDQDEDPLEVDEALQAQEKTIFIPDQQQGGLSLESKKDLEEDDELQKSFIDEETRLEESSSPLSKQKEPIDQNTAQEMSLEELKDEVVQINEEKDGELENSNAHEILRSQATLKLSKDGRELDTYQQIEDELSEKLAQSRLRKIDQLTSSGKISKETVDLHRNQALNTQTNQIGGDIFDAQNQEGELIKGQQQQNTQSKLKSIFTRATDRDTLQERMRAASEQKREQLRKAA